MISIKRDPVVLGENYILPGDDVGKTRPNANVLIVGSTGCGKSKSIVIPTIGRADAGNLILNYAKESDAYEMFQYLHYKGFKVHIMNLIHPERSNISFDMALSIESYADISSIAAAIVDAVIKVTVDDYWPARAKVLLESLIAASFMISSGKKATGMEDILKLFDQTIPVEDGYHVSTHLDGMFQKLAKASPGCFAVRKYMSWRSLPEKTASCVRDTLAAALDVVFPESIREMMQKNKQFDVEQFVNHKEAIIVISSITDKSQQYFANMFYRATEKQLLSYAATCPKGELPREVRYIFDDFACTAKIDGYASDISLFRSAGISAIMLIQSEEQLRAIYGDEAPIIKQNCAVYVYFPGGFDDRTCEVVSKRMGMPYDEILYAEMGKVFIMQSGRKPVHIPRYDVFHSEEFKEYVRVNERKSIRIRGDIA